MLCPSQYKLTACTTWSPQVDYYLHEALRFCRQMEAAVVELKAAGVAVAAACASVRSTLLVCLERKRLYNLAEFDGLQAQHQVRSTCARACLLSCKCLIAQQQQRQRCRADE